MDRAELGKARPWELWSIPEPQFLQLSAGRSLERVEQVCLVSIYVFFKNHWLPHITAEGCVSLPSLVLSLSRVP